MGKRPRVAPLLTRLGKDLRHVRECDRWRRIRTHGHLVPGGGYPEKALPESPEACFGPGARENEGDLQCFGRKEEPFS